MLEMCFTELPGNIVPAEPAVGARVFIHKAGYPASLNEHMLVISTGYKAFINLAVNNVSTNDTYIDVNIIPHAPEDIVNLGWWDNSPPQ